MPFKVAARAVLELGAELISSDEIAIYELVKNAFDANSPDVKVEFRIAMRRTEYEALAEPFMERLYEDDDGEPREPTAAEKEEDRLTFGAGIKVARARLEELGMAEASVDLSLSAVRSQALKVLHDAYIELNTITITDTGDGMSAKVLDEAFLTIGTPYRHNQRGSRGPKDRKLLGEKGVGRLSAMRLGSRLEVMSATLSDKKWNLLSIDWDDFALTGNQLVGDVPLAVRQGGPKIAGKKGTKLLISGIEADWTKAKLENIAIQEFSRISDPFATTKDRFPIEVKFNGEEIKMRRLSSDLFKSAHGYCEGSLRFDKKGNPVFTADFEYRLYHEKENFRKELSELKDAITATVPASALRTLGPFKFEFYWFNRKLLKGIDGIGNQAAVKNLVNSWSGGLMVFRDGFRVNPYGGPGDDWLELNRQAFKSSGYLLNTDQIIGRIRIGSEANPNLVDQTNREGLRDNFEYQALRNLMRHFFVTDLKKYIDRVNDEYAGLKTLDMSAVDRNVESYEKRVERNIRELMKLFPAQESTLRGIKEAFQSMRHAYRQARNEADKSEENSQRLLDLAGIGLLVEVVAHELARATKHTLDLVLSARKKSFGNEIDRTFSGLEAQLQTIERRLRLLDPLSISGRQRKSQLDLADVMQDVFEGRSDELTRNGIGWEIVGSSKPVRITAVRGMIYQIVENLLSNSIHWLGRYGEDNPRFRPKIVVTLTNNNGGGFSFTDNGPGISVKHAEIVFEAFYTTRGEGGRGLGLYIARENARHHGGDLELTGLSEVHENRLNTFTFQMVAK